MDFGGRTVMSLTAWSAAGIGLDRPYLGERHPGLSPVWEFPWARPRF